MVAPRILVVGAGVIGSAVAMRLAEAGAAVTVVEAHRPAAGTSGGSFAWLNANGKTPWHYYAMNLRGMYEHHVLATRSAQWYHPVGHVEWADRAGADELRRRVVRLRSWEYPARMVTRAEFQALEPGMRVPVSAAEFAYFPEEGYVDGDLLVSMMLAHARAAGAEVVTGEEVLDVVVTGGRATGVRLRSGRLDADVVVLCTGWQTADLAARAGTTVPMVAPTVSGSPAVCLIAETEPPEPPGGVRRVVHSPGLVMRPGRHGGVLVEPDHIPEGLRFGVEPPPGLCADLLAAARVVVPGLAGRALVAPRLCVRPLPEDRYPIVGWCPGLDRCYVVVTHSGITLAPYLSTLVCQDLLVGDAPPDGELAPYRPDRFVGVG